MDAIELARQTASKLHCEAVARGADPWKPYEFALAEAKRQEIDVEVVLKGASTLNGSRATFKPEDRLILHEDAGSEFERAFLVAHELGHASLGDDTGSEPIWEIDPARASEPSPIGMDRVVDYSQRQRREVQMDLFAREFLLPRTVAWHLHVEQGMTASDIASKLVVPFDVVAQQLLDALLLPPAEDEKEAELKPDRPLNSLQTEAVEYSGEAYLLEAGPGTGKTKTLTARVEKLLNDGVDPRRILVLTFSNKATGEMAERIARKRKQEASAMWIGTFHSFGLDIIRRFHTDLGLPKEPRLLERTEAVEMLEEEFARLDLRHYRNIHDPTNNIVNILAGISRAKDEVVDAKRYAELAEQMLKSAVSEEQVECAQRACEVAKVYAIYEALKRKKECVDFGDLVLLPVLLLEGNTEVRAHLQTKYDHVLVDEYQDVNRSSVRLLKALHSENNNIWVVGNIQQSIYRFRGASSYNINRFGRTDFTGGERGRLKLNYRSVDEIVRTFSSFAVGMKVGDEDSSLEASRGPSGHRPLFRTFASADQQSEILAESIKDMYLAGYKYRDQAVLCTGNEKLSEIAHDLEGLGVPVLFLGSLFERPEVKDLFAFLNLLTDRRAMGLIRIACLPDFEMSIADVSVVLEHLREHQISAEQWLQGQRKLDNVTPQGRDALDKLAGTLRDFDQCSKPWETLARILLDRTRMATKVSNGTQVADRAKGIAIWQLMNFVKTQPTGDRRIVRLMDRVRRLVRLGDERDLRQLPACAQSIDAVRLMTIHGAKGLEFPVVHLPGLNAGTIPKPSRQPACPPPDGMVEGAEGSVEDALRAGDEAEQECLFYVALSRAKDRLMLYAPTTKSNGANRPISPFVKAIESHLAKSQVTPQLPAQKDSEDDRIELAVDGKISIEGHKMALYEKCPRRFLYTHILEVGGRRTETAFMQMHEAVRYVVKGVVAGEILLGTKEDLDRGITKAFEETGLATHGYETDYRALATKMLQFFISNRSGRAVASPTSLNLSVGQDEMIVQADDVLIDSNGKRILRSIRTGHKPSDEQDDIGTAVFLTAVQRAFPGAVVELVYLADETVEPVTLSPKKLSNRQDKLLDYLKSIRSGHFPYAPSAHACAKCPGFFVCGPTPSGPLRKKFYKILPVAPSRSD